MTVTLDIINPMSENLGNTQPKIKINKNMARDVQFLFNALGLIIILVLAILAGYGSGISIRRDTQSSVISQQLGEQFQYALVDIEFGRYENAHQRLEFIIANDPDFPGAQQKLTEVLVLINAPTPTLTLRSHPRLISPVQNKPLRVHNN